MNHTYFVDLGFNNSHQLQTDERWHISPAHDTAQHPASCQQTLFLCVGVDDEWLFLYKSHLVRWYMIDPN